MEVAELEHGLEVFHGGGAAHALSGAADGGAHRHALACEGFLQLGVGEVANAAQTDDVGCQCSRGQVVGIVDKRSASERVGGEEDFVLLEVGGFEHHAHAVAQQPLRGAQRLVLGGLLDTPCFGGFLHKGGAYSLLRGCLNSKVVHSG